MQDLCREPLDIVTSLVHKLKVLWFQKKNLKVFSLQVYGNCLSLGRG